MVIAKGKIRRQITVDKDKYERLRKKAKAANRAVSNYVVWLIYRDLESSPDKLP